VSARDIHISGIVPYYVQAVQVSRDKSAFRFPPSALMPEDVRSPMKRPYLRHCPRVCFFACRPPIRKPICVCTRRSYRSLHVTVKDPKGNVVANASVTVIDADKGLQRDGSSDGEGGYSVRQLAPGSYNVTVSAPGFGQNGNYRRRNTVEAWPSCR